jgi:hypothetical protein
MRKVFFAWWLLAIPSVGFAQSSPDSAAAIAQARSDLQHLQGEIPRAMMEVRRLTDQAAVDKVTLDAQLDALRNGQPAPTPGEPQPERK